MVISGGYSISTDEGSGIKILVVVKRRCVSDSLMQILGRLPGSKQLVSASGIDEVQAGLADHPNLILADLFGIQDAEDNLRQELLRSRSSSIPLVALLPADTRDYRDAAVELGANGIVVLENAVVDLLPTIERLLARVSLANGIANRIARTAERSAPFGESAQAESIIPLSLEELSGQAIERLATTLIPASSLPVSSENKTPTAVEKQRVFLRGLKLSSACPESDQGEQIFRTACNLNCGSHYCGLKVTVRGGHIVRVEPADFPDNRYRRICLKGISQLQVQAHPDRLKVPLKHSGPRGSGSWQPVSWDQALDEIAEKICSLTDEFGPQSVMFFPYSGQLSVLNGFSGVYMRLASLLGASCTSQSEFGLDSAVPSGIEDTLGKGSGYLANDYTDLPNSRLVLIWGGDPVQSRMNWWPFFMEARRAGTRLVAIDPKFTATAAKCDEWLPIRPGTDLYLALAMLHEIIEKGWIDENFVRNHTVAPLLIEDLTGRFLRSNASPAGENFLVWDSETGGPAFSSQPNAAAFHGSFDVKGRACRPAFDLLEEMIAPYTPELTSAKTGLSIECIHNLAFTYAHKKPARIYTLYGIDRWHHGATFGRLIATLAAITGNIGIPGGGAGVDGICSDLLLISDFLTPDGKSFNSVNPAMVPDYVVHGNPYSIKAMFLAFSNWLNQFPNHNYMLQEVIPRLDLLVVADHFMTETARWADYVLPTSTLFERPDMVKGPGPYLQYQPAILPPLGKCRSDFQIAAGLAERLGVGQYFSRSPDEYLAEIIAGLKNEQEGFSLDTLKEKGVIQINVSKDAGVAHNQLMFKTNTGRVEFYAERLLPYGRALPDYEPPIEANLDSELARRYPLICLTEHSRYRVHSTFINIPWLRELDREPRAAMNPMEAKQRQIQDGDLVRVYNDRGYVVLKAYLSQAIPTGTIYFSQGWQSTDFYDGHPQTLTHNRGNAFNAFGYNIPFSDVLVEVVKES